MKEFDPEDVETRVTDRLVKTAVSPRPIAWVSTTGENGVDNLAPFSSYNYVGSRQPIVTVHTSRREGGDLKDTARNAIDTGEFAVNVVTEATLEPMDRTAEGLPPSESEFDFADVPRAECRTIDPPRVANAAVTMECTLHDSIEIYDRVMLLGDVTYFHVAESVTTDGEIDARKLDTVGRLGGPYYTVSEPMEFEREY